MHEALCDADSVRLTPTRDACEVSPVLFVEKPARVLSRDKIARAPDGHVARLRRKLKGVTGESQERAKRATLASTDAGALEAHVCAQITPVRRIERTQLRTDRHRGGTQPRIRSRLQNRSS
jgi:hypothetical protein